VNLSASLQRHPSRQRLVGHDLFTRIVPEGQLSRDDVSVILGQWWHPLHYFPTFLAQSVITLPEVSMKSYLANILNEELGDGDPDAAHEKVYLDTMNEVGFAPDRISRTPAFKATGALLSGYETASKRTHSALGYIYATEVADLAMVSGIGAAVRSVTRAAELPWVDIHVKQEPNHVSMASAAASSLLSQDDVDEIVGFAAIHWNEWVEFFDEIEAAIT
jgi:hypothetical protein